MRLKKIKLAGFKSFVDPTTIPFPGDMTAIVGPNGCGKSNVIDAVRWVLGESSAKNLRGDAMTDVIFNGSSARKPVGQCSVELVFDNESNRIGGEYAMYNELSVKRLVTRDAQSHYFLNGTKCRRRDVTDLFLGTGLGPRSYAIIEQGMISRLIESKPQELRVFIEEAAGISKYKERRRETENRIRHTQDNLERLEDVRGELGRQLEKLQRQAAAAQRYKALKATERQLKNELSALRWRHHTDHIESLEKEQRQHQNELDALLAKQRGDEAGIEAYRTESESVKAVIDDLQQQRFTVSTQITRLEQNALHSQQRATQIDSELAALHDKSTTLINAMREGQQALNSAEQKLRVAEPELALLEASIEQAVDHADAAEQTLREFSLHRREREQQLHNLKHQVQRLHGEIQTVTSMQMRTTQRIAELDDDLNDGQYAGLVEQHEHQRAVASIAAEKTHIAETDVTLTDTLLREKRQLLEEKNSQLKNSENDLQEQRSSLAALVALQELAEADASQLPDGILALWQAIEVKPGYETLMENMVTWLNDPAVANEYTIETLLASAPHLPSGRRLFPMVQQCNPIKGTLADCVKGSYVPHFFNFIEVVSTLSEAEARLPDLADGVSVATLSGEWLSRDWFIRGTEEAEVQGAIARKAKIVSLEGSIEILSERVYTDLQDRNFAAAAVEQVERQLEEKRQAYVNAIADKREQENKLSVLVSQMNQYRQRQQKLAEEKRKQCEQLEREEIQLASTAEQLEVLEAELAEVQEEDIVSHHKREQLEREASEARQRVDQEKSRLHQLALTVQQQQSQREMYQQQVTRNQQQAAEYAARKTELEKEKQLLSQPLAINEAQLQALLLQREDIETRRIEKQDKLNELEALLREAEQGQQGLQTQIQQRQAVIDGIKIDIEGARVRAMSVLEQLQESGESLKELLPTLDEQANENEWQAQLDKTSAAIARLGAVNLAAVEEYEQQAERKQHLDIQFEDLVTALETLQSAIRKIDKETRMRFSSTFDQVNDGLKQLFPKVFGGGAAYLALTDDDLLETGVTIMARPPGKKNSTIHLLSGGEKALTALSLVFAIFRLNPAPFCLLDEVDAPLDDANVGRFCKLVSEMSKTVQFIYITHNKIAMEMATHLTGVTMAEPGVSRMVAVDVDEAMTFVES